jgi:hypothetical protein
VVEAMAQWQAEPFYKRVRRGRAGRVGAELKLRMLMFPPLCSVVTRLSTEKGPWRTATPMFACSRRFSSRLEGSALGGEDLAWGSSGIGRQ